MSRGMHNNGLLAREIAAMVPMPELLRTLKCAVNLRTHRCHCPLCGGSNPTKFSWREDGRWHCFSCGRGGDRLQLVMEVCSCSFQEALRFLAQLAGVELHDDPAIRKELRKREREQRRLRATAERLAMFEREVLLECRDHLHHLHRLRRKAGAPLAALHRGEPERFQREEELAWEVLRYVADNEASAAAAYTVIAFASPEERAVFALRPHARNEMIASALARGFVDDDKGHIMEVVL